MFLVYVCKGNTKVFTHQIFSLKTLHKVLYLTFVRYYPSNIIVLFTFIHNSLISVILYNVYNVGWWARYIRIQHHTARYSTIQRDTAPYSEIHPDTVPYNQKAAGQRLPASEPYFLIRFAKLIHFCL